MRLLQRGKNVIKKIRFPASSLARRKSSFRPQKVMVHLDLKGAPPKLSYLKEIFPIIVKAGANAILVEYEDTFPYDGQIANISSLNPLSKKDVEKLLQLAKNHGLEVIPLVQTFGHMEHVLKLEEFSHLREMSQYPQSICPSTNESFSIIEQMINQILAAHPDSKFIHIGCDEVFQIGHCSRCKSAMKKLSLKSSSRVKE